MNNITTIYLIPGRSGEMGSGASAGGGFGIPTNRNTRKPSSAALAQAQALANARRAAANQPTGSRIVNVVGTANDNLSTTYNALQANDAQKLLEKLRFAFDSEGWIFASPMELVWDNSISKWRFRIVANVDNQYKNEAIAQGVRSVFLNLRFTDWFQGFGTYQPFTIVSAYVESSQTVVSATPYVPQSNNSTANTNLFGGDFKVPGSDFLTTLANSLGVSTAVTGGILIILAAVILKR